RQDLAAIHNNLAVTRRGATDAEALREYAVARDMYAKLAAEFPGSPQYRFHLSNTHFNSASVLEKLGRIPEAETEHRKALALRKALAADHPLVRDYAVAMGKSACYL